MTNKEQGEKRMKTNEEKRERAYQKKKEKKKQQITDRVTSSALPLSYRCGGEEENEDDNRGPTGESAEVEADREASEFEEAEEERETEG